MKTLAFVLLNLFSTNVFVCKSQGFEFYHISDSATCSLIEFGKEILEYKIYFKYDENKRQIIDSFVFYNSRLEPRLIEISSRYYTDFGKYAVLHSVIKSIDNTIRYGFIDSFFYDNQNLKFSNTYEFQAPTLENKLIEITEYQNNQFNRLESKLNTGVQSSYYGRTYFIYDTMGRLHEEIIYNLDNKTDSIGTLTEKSLYIYNHSTDVDSIFNNYYYDNNTEEYLFVFERNLKNELIKICQFYLIDEIWSKVYECIFHPKTNVSSIDLQASSGKLSFKNQQFFINDMDEDYSSPYIWRAFDLSGNSLFEKITTVPYLPIADFSNRNSPFILDVFSKSKRIASGKFGIINK